VTSVPARHRRRPILTSRQRVHPRTIAKKVISELSLQDSHALGDQRVVAFATVCVTHDHVEAITKRDRVALLRNGKLKQFAWPTELYDKPASAFITGYIGSPAMNLLTVPIVAEGRPGGRDDTAAPLPPILPRPRPARRPRPCHER
jgi:hypothetical protein